MWLANDEKLFPIAKIASARDWAERFGLLNDLP